MHKGAKPPHSDHHNHIEIQRIQNSMVDYLYIIKDRIFAGLALGLLLASAYAFINLRKVPVYEASSSLLVSAQTERVVKMQGVVDSNMTNLFSLEDMRLKLTSGDFIQYVSSKLTEEEVNTLVQPYTDRTGITPNITNLITKNYYVPKGKERFTMNPLIHFKHLTPEGAKLGANRIAELFLEYRKLSIEQSSSNAVIFLESQSKELSEIIEKDELKLQEYRRSRNMVSLEQSQNLVLDRLKNINDVLSQNKIKVLSLETRTDRLEDAIEKNEDLLEIPEIRKSVNITKLLSELESLLTVRADLAEVYLERHPKVIINEAKISIAEDLLNINIQRAVNDLRNQLETAKQEQERLEIDLQNAEEKSLELDRLAVEYNLMRRKLENDKRTLDQILDRLNETKITSKLESSNVRVLQWASLPKRPIYPNPSSIIKFSALLFFISLIGFPIGLDLIDNKVKTAVDIEHYTNVPLLGEIRKIKNHVEDKIHLSSLKQPESLITECFRGIYSRAMIASDVEFPKSLLISSTLPGEGKTFASINLASTFQNHGIKTLLMDCDLRKPSIHKYFGIKNEKGLLNWMNINGNKNISSDFDPLKNEDLDILQMSENLFVLRAGGFTKEPTEKFRTTTFEMLYHKLSNQFDAIVLDTPPAGLFPDAIILSGFVDEAIYIIRHKMVSKFRVRGVITNFEQNQTKVIGAIMNASKGNTSRSGYYGYGSYKYGDYSKYGKYYGDQGDGTVC